MANTVLGVLVEKLKERERDLLESLGDGSAKDYASYRELCGHIRGLAEAQLLISDLAKKLEKEEDE
ncbi:hypothetical protein EBT31_22780 [bacterium]|jgi:hypothetical protein|nr:hypothetical protein [bacterium]